VDRFTSYKTFKSDASKIDKSNFKYVMCDNENWSYTPAVERESPAAYMARFASLAHSYGSVSQDYAAAENVTNYTACPATGEYFTSLSASWFSGVLTDLKDGGY
jgi:hypothetical protein